jgi:hypothetical protein
MRAPPNAAVPIARLDAGQQHHREATAGREDPAQSGGGSLVMRDRPIDAALVPGAEARHLAALP